MASRYLSASDVTRAVEQQNVQVAAGQIGQPPVKGKQVFQYVMSTQGRLTEPEQFAELVLKTDAYGRPVVTLLVQTFFASGQDRRSSSRSSSCVRGRWSGARGCPDP